MVREMLFEIAHQKGRPILLAARVPRRQLHAAGLPGARLPPAQEGANPTGLLDIVIDQRPGLPEDGPLPRGIDRVDVPRVAHEVPALADAGGIGLDGIRIGIEEGFAAFPARESPVLVEAQREHAAVPTEHRNPARARRVEEMAARDGRFRKVDPRLQVHE